MTTQPETTKQNSTMNKILLIFTRTPLHVGAGSSVGAIDQPIIRERHTGFPVIPSSSLKGTLADLWSEQLQEEIENNKIKKVRVKKDGTYSDIAWLFGSDNPDHSFSGALQFAEAKLLAFPVRSARGSFAWITSPLILKRAVRDGVIDKKFDLAKSPQDDEAFFADKNSIELDVDGKKHVVLEEYTFIKANKLPDGLTDAFESLLPDDQVWKEVSSRLVILSDGMMSFFAQNACEVAQHVRINDETGTAEQRALFNKENVPSETLFYTVVYAFNERAKTGKKRTAKDAIDELMRKINETNFIQLGGDSSTGCGYCTLSFLNK